MAKSILGSVGKGGRNRFEDVVVVQYLLNCVPKRRGGPEVELVLDGLCGPKTQAAIVRYQSATFGAADGRVAQGGDTFHALSEYDPYPNQNLNLPSGPQAGDKKWLGKRGGTASANAWDPWGYHNPAGENYRKQGKEPGVKFGKEWEEQWGWKTAQGKMPGAQSGWKEAQGKQPGPQTGWKEAQGKMPGAQINWKQAQGKMPGAQIDWKTAQGKFPGPQTGIKEAQGKMPGPILGKGGIVTKF